MMDLPEKLRLSVAYLENRADQPIPPKWSPTNMLKEAADEIERLNADRETYNKWAVEITAGVDDLKREIGRLRAIVRTNGLRWGHTHAEINAILDPPEDQT